MFSRLRCKTAGHIILFEHFVATNILEQFKNDVRTIQKAQNWQNFDGFILIGKNR